ncbi:hypothetical protein ACO8D0_03275 [Streptomyces pratensis]
MLYSPLLVVLIVAGSVTHRSPCLCCSVTGVPDVMFRAAPWIRNSSQAATLRAVA